jgi:hypothetical protein
MKYPEVHVSKYTFVDLRNFSIEGLDDGKAVGCPIYD